VWNRALARTTEKVGTVWGAVTLAVAFALVGAFVVLPANTDWAQRFGAGVAVASVALLLAWGLLLAGSAALYTWRGDPVWRVGWSIYKRIVPRGVTSSAGGVQLICEGHPPVSVSELGHVEAVILLPSGHFQPFQQQGMGRGPHHLWVAPPNEEGTYEAR
jgi:hypothetical protein